MSIGFKTNVVDIKMLMVEAGQEIKQSGIQL